MSSGIVVTRQGVLVTASPTDLTRLKDGFARDHVIRLREFFAPELLQALDRRLDLAAFRPRVEDGREIELTLDAPDALALTVVALNDPALFAAIDGVTECGSIGCFSGRVHLRRAAPEGGHYYPWHTDAAQQRLVGISVNLGSEPFEGGVFELRRRRSKRLLAQVSNPTRGDAVLFRISRHLEHHVTAVTTQTPRLVLAGWFRRAPDFWQKARACA
jgi:hypothetical protein